MTSVSRKLAYFLLISGFIVVFLSSYPIFFGKSYVFSGYGPQLLYDDFPLIPGYKSSEVADVAESESVDALIDFAIDKMGRIDILVNNAGIYGPKGPTDSVDWAQWVQAINVNLLGSVLMCRAIAGFEVKGPELLKE